MKILRPCDGEWRTADLSHRRVDSRRAHVPSFGAQSYATVSKRYKSPRRRPPTSLKVRFAENPAILLAVIDVRARWSSQAPDDRAKRLIGRAKRLMIERVIAPGGQCQYFHARTVSGTSQSFFPNELRARAQTTHSVPTSTPSASICTIRTGLITLCKVAERLGNCY